ncbi:hypothetical protein C6P40_002496 [Pichia californica]|uniref:HpcH/HpaI aldolase/citrate lyase domain-containing protein n=1 Tax=Pichia californica TaxID=460514 RepID=A0A9P6WI45_9ASCO|nr:hypothetical protein C6P42_002476 [[Candida] californica]KAG0687326.1 hypothetical protein C6P40_002496 [[Candida] californica]
MDKLFVNKLLKNIQTGKRTISLNLKITRTMDVIPMAKTAGYETIFIDGEHSSLSTETINDLCVTALGYGITPIVRVPAKNAAFITKILDGGAFGIVVPHIKTVEDVVEVINASKFWPLGERSASGGFPQFQYESIPASTAYPLLNENTMIIPMIETLESVENLEKIVKIKGVDALLIGSSDLSCVLGVPLDFSSQKYISTMDYILRVCKENNVEIGIGGIQNHPALIEKYTKQGVKWYLGDQDKSVFLNGLQKSFK